MYDGIVFMAFAVGADDDGFLVGGPTFGMVAGRGGRLLIRVPEGDTELLPSIQPSFCIDRGDVGGEDEGEPPGDCRPLSPASSEVEAEGSLAFSEVRESFRLLVNAKNRSTVLLRLAAEEVVLGCPTSIQPSFSSSPFEGVEVAETRSPPFSETLSRGWTKLMS